ncbi:MAG: two-component sensor histidine kinase [Rhizobiales bacterium]|nr:two-component sensor histidine kinase [Hyphomicrobiales bacterium]
MTDAYRLEAAGSAPGTTAGEENGAAVDAAARTAETGQPTVRSSDRFEAARSVADRVLDRLAVRGWLLAVAVAVIVLLGVRSGLPAGEVVVAVAVVLLVALVLPRHGLPRESPLGAARAARSRHGIPLRQWEHVLAALPDAAVLVSQYGSVLAANGSARDLIANLEAGTDISALIRDPDFLDAIEEVQSGGGPLTVRYTERVPVERFLTATVSRLDRSSGQAAQPDLLVTFRDVSEQHRLERMRADFVSYASHELRTPLASLLGFIETLRGRARDDAAARERFLEIMAAEGARMSRLIDDLLSLSRIEMKAHLPPRDRVELADVARHVHETMLPLADDRSMTLELELDADGEDTEVRGERDDLVQVLQNLVQNAIKYGNEQGHVAIRLRLEGRGSRTPIVVVDVVDDGPGIAAHHLPRLTERFYRVESDGRSRPGGTGLGLAIVKHILNRHRGEISILSTPGRGSTFSVRLPALNKSR